MGPVTNSPSTPGPERGSQVTKATLPLLTLGIASRLLYFERALGRVRDVEGDVVECGVGWGRSLLEIALLVRIEDGGRRIWAFDSFEGFPEPAPEDKSSRNVQKGEWKTKIESVVEMLYASGLDSEFVDFRITLIKGFFNESLAKYTGERIALLHIDVDLYQSYRDVLGALYGKVAPGGVILFDEYLNTMEYELFPGAARAVSEFFEGKEPILRDVSGRYYVRKAT